MLLPFSINQIKTTFLRVNAREKSLQIFQGQSVQKSKCLKAKCPRSKCLKLKVSEDKVSERKMSKTPKPQNPGWMNCVRELKINN